jgi:uncharacterized protein (UPF0548 family)
VKVGYRNWFGRVDHRGALEDLRTREPNFRDEELAQPGWHHDLHRSRLPDELPGDPQPGGAWELARRLIDIYEAPEPSIIRGLYAAASPLIGRDMLLEARFYGLHFSMGVRVTHVVDELRDDGTRVWGWSYDTLEGHVERGRMSYEVVKHVDSGHVEFVTRGVSEPAPTLGPLLRLGWSLFGRRTQVRFYRRCGQRMQRIVSASLEDGHRFPRPVVVDGLVHAPSDAAPRTRDRFALHSKHPG